MNFPASCFETWHQGGWLMFPIAAVSAGIWWLTLRLHRRLRGMLGSSADVETRMLADAETGEARADDSPLAAMAAYALNPSSPEATDRRFEEVRQAEVEPLRRDLGVLAAMVAAAPLLGLLGTVFGMIGTFEAIAGQSRETSRLMAAGVSQGLITTQFGLIVAIPGVFGLSVLGKRIRQFEIKLVSLKALCLEGLRRRRAP